jgi:parallel beta-helix repeat protein
MKKERDMKKLLAIFAALAAIGLEAHVASAARTCDSVITPGEDLAKAAADCPPSTTFIIKDGAYKLTGPIDADSGDTFKGTHSDGSLPTINAQRAEIAFDVSGTNRVTIRSLSISGAGGGDKCAPACGGAIKGDGTKLHVLNARLHHNANQGIGNPGDGFILKNSEIDHNGSYRFTSLDSSSSKDTSSSAGVKIAGNSATLTNNRVHHNYWHGIWCDLKGGPIVVTGNRVHNNGKSGIKYEICKGPGSKIAHNSVVHNGYLKKGSSDLEGRAGILLQTAQSVEVANNTVQDNRGHGIYAKDSNRGKTFGVSIHHNSMRNDSVGGCQISGVKCEANGR